MSSPSGSQTETPEKKCDNTVILVLRNEDITCDKDVLIENSDYFRVMFEGNFIESNKETIELKEIEPEPFSNLLKIVWDQACLERIHDLETLFPILRISSMLQFQQTETIVTYLHQHLKPETSLPIWFHTEQIGALSITLKAKTLALIHYDSLRYNTTFLNLNINEVGVYLAHRYLQVADEKTIFDSALRWYHKNINEDEPDKLSIAYELVSCLDFNALENSDIEELKRNDLIIDEFARVLDMILSKRDEQEVPEEVDRMLTGCEWRCPPVTPGLVFKDREGCGGNVDVWLKDKYRRKKRAKEMRPSNVVYNWISYYDPVKNTAHNWMDVSHLDLDILNRDLTGFGMLYYKHYLMLFGGEFLMGHGRWNQRLWMYDTIKETYHRFIHIPFVRRHFASCVCDNFLYIIGGTGTFRVLQQNAFYYDCLNDKWSAEIILPCSFHNVKCCNFQNRLFLLSISSKCGYFFNQEKNNWTQIELECSQVDLPKHFSAQFMCSYKNKLYIKGTTCKNRIYRKGTCLLEVCLLNNKLTMTNKREIRTDEVDTFIEAAFCQGFIYTLYKYLISKDSDDQNKIKLEIFDIETGSSNWIYEIESDIEPKVVLNQCIKVFPLYRYDLAKRNVFVNSFRK